MSKRLVCACLAALTLAADGGSQEPRWFARPLVRAGTLDGPGALAGPFDVEVGRSGEILVAQPQAASIAVFAANGQYVRAVGRRGQGPGEFQAVGRMGWMGDTLWVVDFGRLHTFDRDLEYVRTIGPLTVTPRAGLRMLLPGPLMADGSVLGIPVEPEAGRASPVVLMDASGSIRRTLAEVSESDRSIDFRGPDDRVVQLTNPWSHRTLWMREADGRSIVIIKRPAPDRAADAAFEILRVGIRGDTLLHRRTPYQPRPVTRQQGDQVYSELAKRFTGPNGWTQAQAERNVRDALPPPRSHAPVSELVVGQDGTIWLRRENTLEDSVLWQVFSPTGQLVGQLELPSKFRLHRARSDRAWGIVKNSLDVPFVQVYEISAQRRE